MSRPLPERDPSEVMDRFELAALEEVLAEPFSLDDFVDAPRPAEGIEKQP